MGSYYIQHSAKGLCSTNIYFQREMAHCTILTFLAVMMIGMTLARSSMPDILMEREETNEIQNNPLIPMGRIVVNGPMDVAVKVPCQIEVVKTEKINGKCEKFGPTHVCVADRYVLPSHQDCMFSS